jgi:hypothetical protein
MYQSRYVTSARTGSNVEAAFLDLVERAVAFMDQQDKAAAAAAATAMKNAATATEAAVSAFFGFLVKGGTTKVLIDIRCWLTDDDPLLVSCVCAVFLFVFFLNFRSID